MGAEPAEKKSVASSPVPPRAARAMESGRGENGGVFIFDDDEREWEAEIDGAIDTFAADSAPRLSDMASSGAQTSERRHRRQKGKQNGRGESERGKVTRCERNGLSVFAHRCRHDQVEGTRCRWGERQRCREGVKEGLMEEGIDETHGHASAAAHFPHSSLPSVCVVGSRFPRHPDTSTPAQCYAVQATRSHTYTHTQCPSPEGLCSPVPRPTPRRPTAGAGPARVDRARRSG